MAELLGILHLLLMVISVLGEVLDLGGMFLGELGEFGPQLFIFIWRKRDKLVCASLPEIHLGKGRLFTFQPLHLVREGPDVFLGSLCKSEGDTNVNKDRISGRRFKVKFERQGGTLGKLQVGLRHLVRVGQLPVVREQFLVYFGPGSCADLRKAKDKLSKTVS